MLNAEKNALLTEVGPSTAMGGLMREHWLPCYASADLLADDQPTPIRLLGEDLLLWRDTEGRVGLVDPVCPHRGAPLVFGRNEHLGLRCVYHGWKFDTDGHCLDMPTEPPDSRFLAKIRLSHYPCRERGGVVWTFLGPGAAPPLPELEWNLVPAEQCHVSIRVQECNWLQALEGEVDSAHAPILHGRLDGQGSIADMLASADLRPVFDVLRRDFGVSVASSRRAAEGHLYWRVNQFLLPFYTLVPPRGRYPELSGHAWVPIDDEHTLCVMFSYHPDTPLPARTVELYEQGHRGRETGHLSRSGRDPNASGPYARYRTRFTRENGYRFDYASQRETYFSGLPGLWVQDAACQSGLRPILDRTREHLSSSDAGIAIVRRALLDAVAAHRDEGLAPAPATDPSLYLVRAVSLLLKEDESWFEAAEAPMRARPGSGFGYEVP
ncbi:MAG TPA: Rieske 2Fe-2S domain-containing protein [Pseudonocardia sp.]|jgi:phenylpropionate dioxygenase-like ring-hydroxylating dioxygenase large terminal subunit